MTCCWLAALLTRLGNFSLFRTQQVLAGERASKHVTLILLNLSWFSHRLLQSTVHDFRSSELLIFSSTLLRFGKTKENTSPIQKMGEGSPQPWDLTPRAEQDGRTASATVCRVEFTYVQSRCRHIRWSNPLVANKRRRWPWWFPYFVADEEKLNFDFELQLSWWKAFVLFLLLSLSSLPVRLGTQAQ